MYGKDDFTRIPVQFLLIHLLNTTQSVHRCSFGSGMRHNLAKPEICYDEKILKCNRVDEH